MKDTSKPGGNGDAVAKVPPGGITQDLVRERFTDAIRAQVGRGKEFSREGLAAETGLDVSSIGSWMNEEVVPPLYRVLKLMAVMGPCFANRLLALAGMTGADWIDPDAVSVLGVNAAAAELSAEVAGALADGRITADEQARIDARIGVLHERAGDYLAGRHRVSINRTMLRVVGGGS